MAAQAPCTVCRQPTARYRCPRCSGAYCSVPCYRQHSHRCTNAFYEANVQECMAQEEVPQLLKEQTLAILQREQQQQEEAEEHDVQIRVAEEETAALLAAMARLEALEASGTVSDAAVADIVMVLPPTLRQQFRQSVCSGSILEDLPALSWTPWYRQTVPKIVELAEAGVEKEEGAAPMGAPAVPHVIGSLSTLTAKASPLLYCNVIETLYGYCFALHAFHGDWRGDAPGFLALLLTLSRSLAPRLGKQSDAGMADSDTSTPVIHRDLDEVYFWLLDSRPAGALYDFGPSFSLAILEDVACLLGGGQEAVLRALGDIMAAVDFRRSAPHLVPVKRKERKVLQLVAHKLQFYLCWTAEEPPEHWTGWAAEVGAAFQLRRTRLPLSPPPSVMEVVGRQDASQPHNAATAASRLVVELPAAPETEN
eukprot:GGOE01003808.1.p1 GENE.GGOE01003808.1~~GGOE01003808.1.p1  ORF type:complete len:447 (+),score=94.72 GGOE01003808.1:74-1342(+)